MAATYNWTYRDGIPNKYGFVIPAVADNVRPAGFAYVALFGNDNIGNGSRQHPFKTLLGGVSSCPNSTTFIVGSGTYRDNLENTDGTAMTIIGDGDVTYDYSYYVIDASTNLSTTGDHGIVAYNVKFVGNGNFSDLAIVDRNGFVGTDCIFINCRITSRSVITMTNCLVINSSSASSATTITASGCTFYSCIGVIIAANSANNIFHTCNIQSRNGISTIIRYSIFYQCNFYFNNGSLLGVSGPLYPGVPTSFAYISNISDLIAAFNSAFPSVTVAFAGCVFSDPLFNNPLNNDFSLSKTSPAQNLSYFGTYIGNIGLGMSIIARATEADGSFDFSTNTNLTIADDSITFTDPTIDAQIDTVPQQNQLTRIINAIPLFGFNSDRNGQYVDSIPDLGSVVATSGTLAYPSSWIVQVAAITYNGSTYQPGDRFTTVSGQATFASTSGGQVQEIVEAPERHTIMARFSDGGTAVTDTDALVAGNWYFVISGTATYGGNANAAGSYFKAVDTSSWSGTAAIELAFPGEGTLAFQHYDPAFQPMTNNVGDVRTGAVVRGNGDPAYVRGTGKEWPINSKHMQFRYCLKANNLTP
jgi:hypothetical protein